jgi:hypothetical protein
LTDEAPARREVESDQLIWLDPPQPQVATASATVDKSGSTTIARPATADAILGPYGLADSAPLAETGAGVARAGVARADLDAPVAAGTVRIRPPADTLDLPTHVDATSSGPPRIRGFVTAGVQPVQIPAELTDAAQGTGTADLRWRSRASSESARQ